MQLLPRKVVRSSVPSQMPEEIACAHRQRRVEDLLGRSLLDDRAALEHDDTMRDPAGETHFVE